MLRRLPVFNIGPELPSHASKMFAFELGLKSTGNNRKSIVVDFCLRGHMWQVNDVLFI